MNEFCLHGIAEDDVQDGLTAAVRGNDGCTDILAAHIAADEIREIGLPILFIGVSFDLDLLTLVHSYLPPFLPAPRWREIARASSLVLPSSSALRYL